MHTHDYGIKSVWHRLTRLCLIYHLHYINLQMGQPMRAPLKSSSKNIRMVTSTYPLGLKGVVVGQGDLKPLRKARWI